jgi:hypothetical protein
LCGSRKEGCDELRYRRQDESYQSLGDIDSSAPSPIIDQVQRELAKQTMIVQPLLQTNSLIAPACKDNLLATICIFTALQEGDVALVCAILEIPLSAQDKTVFPLTICLSTGEVLPARLSVLLMSSKGRGQHSDWIESLRARKPDNVVAVTYAAKQVRMIWAVMAGKPAPLVA